MPPMPVKAKLVPYRILAYLLYMSTAPDDLRTSDGWLLQLSPGKLILRPGAASRYFRMKREDLMLHLRWMKQEGLIQELYPTKLKGYYHVTLIHPTNFLDVPPGSLEENPVVAKILKGISPIPRQSTASSIVLESNDVPF